MVETLSISGNIVDLGALLKSFPRLRVLGITFRGIELRSIEAELATLESAVAALGLKLSRLGIVFANVGMGRSEDDVSRPFSLLQLGSRLRSSSSLAAAPSNNLIPICSVSIAPRRSR